MKKLIIGFNSLPVKHQNALAALIYLTALFALCAFILQAFAAR